ncbi:MAG TPA: DUF2059 domain-containing protein [Thermoanaerobaculia bacterium]|nr:DUF2059 domain-containing protein [Thermoanaerobaculia bacterium]
MKPSTLFVMLAIALTLNEPLLAEDAGVKRRQLIEDVMKALNIDGLTRTVMETYFLEDARSIAAKADLSEEGRRKWEAQNQDWRKQQILLGERMTRRVDLNAFARAVYYPLFDRSYSVSELEQLLAFLQTPAGRKTAALLPQVTRQALVEGDLVLEREEKLATEELNAARRREQVARTPRWQLTMFDMQSLAVGIERYATDYNRYPAPADLATSLVPAYLKTFHGKDAWGTDFLYLMTMAGRPLYRIVSAGSDRLFEQESRQLDEALTPRTSERSADDIVFQQGTFLRYPKESSGVAPQIP